MVGTPPLAAVSRPHWSPLAGCSTTHRQCTPPHQPQSSGATMAIISSSRPSTPRIMREGGRSRWQRIRAPPRLRVHHHLLACLIRRAYCRALRRQASATSSSAAAGARIVTSPLSATVKGVATSRAATSREILNLLRRHERHPRRMLCAPLALHWALGVYGCCNTSSDGGLAAQIPAPPVREVRWDGQPCRISVDLLHLHPRCRRR
jgi:hypothetical protein